MLGLALVVAAEPAEAGQAREREVAQEPARAAELARVAVVVGLEWELAQAVAEAGRALASGPDRDGRDAPDGRGGWGDRGDRGGQGGRAWT